MTNQRGVGLSYTQLNERIVQLNKRNNEAVIKYIRTQRKTARQSTHNDGRISDFAYYDGKTIALSEILGHFCELDSKIKLINSIKSGILRIKSVI